MLLESDQKLVDAIPAEIKEKIDGFSESFALQIGFGWGEQPLPQGYAPESVDVYLDGADEPCVFVFQSRLISMNPEFFGDYSKATMIVSIDEIARYVQVHGEVLLDTLGDCLLPDILVSPTAQLSYLTRLLPRPTLPPE